MANARHGPEMSQPAGDRRERRGAAPGRAVTIDTPDAALRFDD
jgi:hypothetical protein